MRKLPSQRRFWKDVVGIKWKELGGKVLNSMWWGCPSFLVEWNVWPSCPTPTFGIRDVPRCVDWNAKIIGRQSYAGTLDGTPSWCTMRCPVGTWVLAWWCPSDMVEQLGVKGKELKDGVVNKEGYNFFSCYIGRERRVM